MSGSWLIVILCLGIIFIIISTSKYKLHPFLALIIAAYGIGLSAGLPFSELAKVITGGFGGILSYIGIVIVFGTLIGIILEKSGAAIKIADTVLKVVGEKRPVLAMSFIGMIVSIPVFCDSGFIILSSLNKSLIRLTKRSAVAMSVALATGLFATHTLVPPTPGPIAAAGNLELANLGMLIIMGLFVAFITAMAGLAWANYAGKWNKSELDNIESIDLENDEQVKKHYGKLPSNFLSFAPIIVPIFLMALASVILLIFDEPKSIFQVMTVLGQPANALFIGLLFALALLPKFDKETLFDWMEQGVHSAGTILIITGAGGALGGVLKATNIGDYLGQWLQSYQLGIFVPFIIAAALKTAQGSSTTALVVTSGIMLPLLSSIGMDSDMGKVLVVLAIGAGAMTVSHANDSFFWVVSQFSKMEVSVAYKAYTMATLIQGIVAISMVYVLSLIVI